MAIGDVAIYRLATGGTNYTSTSLVDWDWDTNQREDAIYDRTDESVELGEAGHYFLSYSLGTEMDGGTLRSELLATPIVNTTDQYPYGCSTGFIRRFAGLEQTIQASATIIDVSANDDLKLQVKRTDDNTSVAVDASDDLSGLCIIKLNDDWNYFRAQNTSDQTLSAGGNNPPIVPADLTWADLEFTTQDEYDTAGYTHATGTDPEEITLDNNKRYLVTYQVHGDSPSAPARLNLIARLVLDGTADYGSYSTGYARGTNSTEEPVCSGCTVIHTSTTSQVLKLQAAIDGENTSTNLVVSACAITIVELPAHAETISLRDAGYFTALADPGELREFDTQDQIDTDSFTHSTSVDPEELTCDVADDYLFLLSFLHRRTTTSTARRAPEARLYSGGEVKYGGVATINRGDATTAGTWFAAGSAAGVLELAADAVVGYTSWDRAVGTFLAPGDISGQWHAGHTVLHGIRVGTLVLGPIDVAASLLSVEFDLKVPVVGVGIDVDAALQSVEVALYEPTVAIGIEVAAPLQSVEVTLYEPVVGVGIDVDVTLQSVEVALYEPVVGVGIDETATLQPVEVALYEPVVGVGIDTGPRLISYEVTLYEPVVGVGIDVAAPLQSVGLSLPKITVHVGINVAAPLQSVEVALYEPVVGVGIDVDAALQSVEVALYEPLVSAGSEISAPLQSIDVTLYEPTVAIGIDVAASLLSVVVTLHEPAVAIGIDVAPSLLSVVAAIHAPTVSSGTDVLAELLAVTVALHEPVVGIGIDVAPNLLQVEIDLKTPVVDVALPVDVAAPLLQYTSALWQPQVVVAAATIIVMPFVFHYYIHLPPVLVVVGQTIRTQKKRVMNAIRERADVGLFLPARIDSNTGSVSIGTDDEAVSPSIILVDETSALMGLPRRNRQTDRDERHSWTWELVLQFAETVTVEPFESDILETPITLVSVPSDDLGSVRLRFKNTQYEHPPQQNSSSGSRVIMSFEADLSPV